MYCDTFSLGGYSITGQSFVAATMVQNELLDTGFSGLIGLALPANSAISSLLPTVATGFDGTTFSSHLFTSPSPPSNQFLSFSLERPGSTKIHSQLGIGMHPTSLVPDPTKLLYSSVVSSTIGPLYWRVHVTGFTTYVDSKPRVMSLGPSGVDRTSQYPIAVLDTGGTNIIATPDLAKAFYAPWNIVPASDGSCTTSTPPDRLADEVEFATSERCVERMIERVDESNLIFLILEDVNNTVEEWRLHECTRQNRNTNFEANENE